MEKVHVKWMAIELGTVCNMRCKHCYVGETEKKVRPFNLEYIDEICKYIYRVNALMFVGGEPSLYTEDIVKIVDRFLYNNVPINRIDIATNGAMKSQKLIDAVNHCIEIAARPERCRLQISVDKFHFEDFSNDELLKENREWYRERLQGHYALSPILSGVVLSGNAKKQKKEFYPDEMPLLIHDVMPCLEYKCRTRDVCSGKDNACIKGGTVYNCFEPLIYLNNKGEVHLHECTSETPLCSVYDNFLEEVEKWDAKCVERKYPRINFSIPKFSSWWNDRIQALIYYSKSGMRTILESSENDFDGLQRLGSEIDATVGYYYECKEKFKIEKSIVRDVLESAIDTIYQNFGYVVRIKCDHNHSLLDSERNELKSYLYPKSNVEDLYCQLYKAYNESDYDGYARIFREIMKYK